VDQNFIVDHHPDYDNVWLCGGGSAEAFKFGPVLGEYIAKRILGVADPPELAAAFRLKEKEFEEEKKEPGARS
jgi:glycine/D-amino acid oxidase-like deaminating enzyme